jgi:hypothetical protein
MMANWTKEKLSEHSNDEIESLRNNAIRLHKPDIVDLCNEELASRAPVRKNKVSGDIREDHTGQYVAEFHFVCPNELGVMRNSDGTIWTGTWVVDEDHAKAAVKHSSYVALHSSKAELSYLHGIVKDWRRRDRERRYTGEQLTQTRSGIDFLFQPSDAPFEWKGHATGEKGYAWAPLPE